MIIKREKFIIKWAVKNGYSVNFDVLADIAIGLDKKKELYGATYCPCIPPNKHSIDYICPCKPCRDKKGDHNTCHCGLFSWED